LTKVEQTKRTTQRSPLAIAAPFAVVVAIAVCYGIALRLWLLFHLPLFGDEAVVGLMAKRINGGHLSVFYWGQSYGGAEPYLAALLLRVGGSSSVSLNLTAAVC
jgi:predicted membrane-bound mannosyltransferase